MAKLGAYKIWDQKSNRRDFPLVRAKQVDAFARRCMSLFRLLESLRIGLEAARLSSLAFLGRAACGSLGRYRGCGIGYFSSVGFGAVGNYARLVGSGRGRDDGVMVKSQRLTCTCWSRVRYRF